MAKAQLQKNWAITPNVVYPYAGFPQMAQWWFYQIKVALVAAGWTLKWSSNGVVGPANAADNTDRITYPASGTRANIANAPQTYMVLQNVDGIQFLAAYQGGFDDFIRLSFSISGLFTLAATTTFQPTATDEVVLNSANSIFEGTAGINRVLQIGATSESFFFAVYHTNTLRGLYGLEKFDSAIDSVQVLPKPYMGYRWGSLGDLARDVSVGKILGGCLTTAFGAAGWSGFVTRGVTGGVSRNLRLGASDFTIPLNNGASQTGPGGGTMLANQGSLQNGNSMPLVPLYLWGARIANEDGFGGNPIDWWLGMGANVNTPTQGDMFPGLDPGDTQASPLRPNWLVAYGPGFVRPWRNADVSFKTG